jgi:hypothetical protein
MVVGSREGKGPGSHSPLHRHVLSDLASFHEAPPLRGSTTYLTSQVCHRPLMNSPLVTFMTQALKILSIRKVIISGGSSSRIEQS